MLNSTVEIAYPFPIRELDFPEGQRSRGERRAYVEAAVRILLTVSSTPMVALDALLERYVEGEMLLTDLLNALKQDATLC